ncbi:MAG: hypothetical protein KAI79_05300 [Bacteroidales bacterium]|nr:hypothetical protein [Bacteroidales bacterium]
MKVNKVLLDKAQKIVKQNKNFSPSFLQRKLAIGYNKARCLIDIISEPYELRLMLKNRQRVRLFSKNKKRFRLFKNKCKS